MANNEKRIGELLANFITANLDAILETIDDSDFEKEVKEVVENDNFYVKIG